MIWSRSEQFPSGMGPLPAERHAVAVPVKAHPGDAGTHQKEAAAAGTVQARRRERIRHVVWVERVPLVFHLEQHFVSGLQVADEGALAGITAVAVPKGVDDGFMQGQPDGEHIFPGIANGPHPNGQ